VILASAQAQIASDIKPDNIMMDVDLDSDGFFKVKDVQIADLEDAVMLGPDGALAGCLCGHDFWRSPEAWARARQDLSSDVFSLGIVVRFGI
jgi:serine/threonine protein kinase